MQRLVLCPSVSMDRVAITVLVVALTACGGDGFPSGSPDNSSNRAPVVEVRADSSVEEKTGSGIEVNGYDPDGDSVSIEWEQTAGLPVVLDQIARNMVVFDVPSYEHGQSTLRFLVTVSDDQGAATTETVEMMITADFFELSYYDTDFSTGTTAVIGGGEDMKYRLSVPEAGEYRFSVRSLYGVPALSVFSDATLAATTLISSATPVSGYENETRISLDAGQEVFVRIDASQETEFDFAVYPLSQYLEQGFPVDTIGFNGTYQSGQSSALVAVGNIDSDAELEILASGFAAGPLYAWNFNGIPVPGWPEQQSIAVVYPSMGNLSGSNTQLEIAAGTGPFVATCGFPGYYTFTETGVPLTGWPIDACTNGANAAPVLADVDGDGQEEIFFNGMGYDAAGNPLAAWTSQYEEYSIADLDGDGAPNFITYDASGITAYDAERITLPGFPAPFSNDTEDISAAQGGPTVIGNVIGDGAPEIVSIRKVRDNPSWMLIDVFDNGGTLLHSWSTIDSVGWTTAPALGDMDGDGDAEIVVQTDDYLHVFQGDGSDHPGWPVMYEGEDHLFVHAASPLIADVDGDQLQDVVAVTQEALLVYSRDGALTHRIAIPPVDRMPAVADIDLDGRNEIIVGAPMVDGSRQIGETVWVFDLGGADHGPIEWGQYGGDARHRNAWPVPD